MPGVRDAQARHAYVAETRYMKKDTQSFALTMISVPLLLIGATGLHAFTNPPLPLAETVPPEPVVAEASVEEIPAPEPEPVVPAPVAPVPVRAPAPVPVPVPAPVVVPAPVATVTPEPVAPVKKQTTKKTRRTRAS